MSINRAPFNALVDDTGNGTSGTPWNKQAIQDVLLDPIDAAFVPTYGTWTPTDQSGAGLVFQSGTTGTWAKIDRLVYVWCQLLYPATANGAAAKIGFVPYAIRSVAGGAQGYGVNHVWYFPINTQTFQPMNPATVAPRTNAEMSGSNVIVSTVYLTD